MMSFKDEELISTATIRRFVLADKKLKEKQMVKVCELVYKHLELNGKIYWSDDVKEAYFFSKVQNRIYTIGLPEFAALCHGIYRLNNTRPLWKYLEAYLNSEASLYAERTKMHLSSFFNKKNKTLYVQNGVSHMYRLDGESSPVLLDNGSDGVLFRDNNMEEFEPDYEFEGSPTDNHLVKMINATDRDVLDLYKIHIHSIFFESIMPTKMCVLFSGIKGSGKSSGARALLQFLFGSKGNVSSEPEDRPDYYATVTNSNVVCFDNMDNYVKWLGNALAMTCTGHTYRRRALYTNNGFVEYPVNCFIIITTRMPASFKRDDIADRLLLIEMKQRSTEGEDGYYTDGAVGDGALENRNKIWGEFLLKLNEIVNVLRTSERPRDKKYKIRMADFAAFCSDASAPLGIPDTIKKLAKLEETKHEFVFENNAIFEGISRWCQVESNTNRRISSGELYNEIKRIYRESDEIYQVKDSARFGTQLKSTAKQMNQWFAIKIEERCSGNKTFITITPNYKIEEKETDQNIYM